MYNDLARFKLFGFELAEGCSPAASFQYLASNFPYVARTE